MFKFARILHLELPLNPCWAQYAVTQNAAIQYAEAQNVKFWQT